MYFKGSFVNRSEELISVHILTDNDREQVVEIGGKDSPLYFDGVEITAEVNDTFDHLLTHSAVIRLHARDYIPEFYAATCRQVVVNIFRGSQCVFAGFVEPQAYSQAFCDTYDEIDLNCVDLLSALQYSKYRGIGYAGVEYVDVKGTASQVTFESLLNSILIAPAAEMDIAGGNHVRIMYDGSKSMSQTSDRYGIFAGIAANEALFLGDVEDDVWDDDVILEEMMRYLNLHIMQEGFAFYIFDWRTAKSKNNIQWCDLITGEQWDMIRHNVTISGDNVSDASPQINIGESYNRISLTCSREAVDLLIQSPLDSDSLASPYTGRQIYMTEYSSPSGAGDNTYRALMDMLLQKAPYANPEAVVREWYLRVMTHPDWIFPKNGDVLTDLIKELCVDNSRQHDLPNYLAQNIGAALLSIGKVEPWGSPDDTSRPNKIDMTTNLVISVNGNGQDTDFATAYPGDNDLLASMPVAGYIGGTSGGALSPADDQITNYLVISGSITLNPIMDITGSVSYLRSYSDVDSLKWYVGAMNKMMPYKEGESNRLYTRLYWRADKPTTRPIDVPGQETGFYPYTGEARKELPYNYSVVGDKTGVDRINKVAVVACMLIVGDKVLVESQVGESATVLQWVDYKPHTPEISDDEYYSQCFFLGINPKIGDYIVGQEYKIASNIDYTMGLDVEGMAIPIRRSDRLSGKVSFMILGPVNSTWDDITRRHRTWFRREKWSSTARAILARVSSIIIKQLEIKVMTDNGKIDLLDDNDLVYVSDTDERYVNCKDDLEMRISSELTAEECRELGVSAGSNLGTAIDVAESTGVLSVYDHTIAEQAKPEQLYVDAYWHEYHKPRIVLEQSFVGDSAIVYFDIFEHPALPGRELYPIGISRDLYTASATVTLKEIDND